jgi:coatomer subunit beta'
MQIVVTKSSICIEKNVQLFGLRWTNRRLVYIYWQKYVGSIKIKKAHTAVRSFKFIARKGWLVVGTTDGFVCVYNHKKEMQETASFKAGDEVQSLAIHPTKSFVLSACTTGIKLWDWDGGWFGWKCMRTFQEHSGSVRAVAFNPQDHNSFASASRDCTIKVLLFLLSPLSKI